LIVVFNADGTLCISLFLADDDSDNNPHDFEGNNSDLELGLDEMAHFKGQNSFTQMQVRKKSSEKFR
jgi:hypothetical protein